MGGVEEDGQVDREGSADLIKVSGGFVYFIELCLLNVKRINKIRKCNYLVFALIVF